ncbi:endonuclease domain-containing protein [Aquipuribacter sp. MA13-6]|uniref:endonuclease domain-containing protein n=1 Tax=unclassified Aquipuribacter TaxID=2635084 RepID=UPI003EEF1C70
MDAARRLMLLHSQPFATAEAEGLVSPDVLRGPRYRQLMHAAHQKSTIPVDHGRRLQAFRRTHDEGFVLLTRSAAWAHGAVFAAADDPVAVAIPTRHRLARTTEVTPHLAVLEDDEVTTTPFGPSTSLDRTVVDLARGLGRPGALVGDLVAQVDALLRATTLTASEARQAVLGYRRLHGLATAHQVVDLCRDGVDSPPETRLRLLLTAAGLPEPTTQCPVELEGRVVARLDLGWPDLRVGCEYDGSVHLAPEQVRVDLRRHNLIRQAGWLVLQVDRHQMRRPDRVVEQARHLLGL